MSLCDFILSTLVSSSLSLSLSCSAHSIAFRRCVIFVLVVVAAHLITVGVVWTIYLSDPNALTHSFVYSIHCIAYTHAHTRATIFATVYRICLCQIVNPWLLKASEISYTLFLSASDRPPKSVHTRRVWVA